MTKTLNQIFFFPPPKSEYFFQQHWESEYFFRKKNITPLQVKWSIPYDITNKNNNICFESLKIHYHYYHSSSYQTRY
jgi:hypothetical protein